MRTFFSLVAALLCLQLHAQFAINGIEVSHYVFPEFVKGTVLKKSGEKLAALLNYNSLTEEIIFDQNGTKLALTQLQDIDTVFLQERKFIPVAKVFYEVTPTTVPLFIEHKSEIIPPGNPTPFGNSQASAISNLSNFRTQGGAYQLKLPDEFQIASKTIYYLRKEGNYYIVKNSKNVEDLYPEKKEAIKLFVKQNKLDFKHYQDLAKLLSIL